MLVLTRKLGEAIQIGEEVTIEVLEVHGNRVRLGITAPGHVGVHRAELLIPTSVAASNAPTMRAVPSVAVGQRQRVALPVSS